MKRIITILLLLAGIINTLTGQQLIQGTVLDENSQALPYVNVFIKETLEGGSTTESGSFEIQTSQTGEITLCALMLGYENWEKKAMAVDFTDITIRMKPTNVALEGIEVVASSFNLQGSSQWKKMNAVDMVTVGGSAGDLYRSIETLPGTQMNGENGRLFIRGGESREAQTYIDDMHVLIPYTTSGAENAPVRSRYSPFMFEGMNFSLGGYDSEYGQGLSSVLPLTTKDESLISKYGVNMSSIGPGGGGTKSFEEGSASVNFDYQNLGPYYSVVPDRNTWKRPYQKISGQTQLRYNPSSRTVAKVYAGIDYTTLSTDNEHLMDLKEENYYVNGTFRHQTSNGYKLFGGAAFSFLNQNIEGATVANDQYRKKESELHLKIKGEKRFSSLLKVQLGAETMVRMFDESYHSGIAYNAKINHSIHSIFATGSINLSEQLSTSFSSRMEYTTANKEWHYMPRLTLNYNVKNVYLSGIIGRYTQLTYNDYLLRERSVPSESCWHYILGAYHQSHGRIYRLEAYYKDYDRLVCENNGLPEASGYGYSKGIDAFFNDYSMIRNLEYRLSYSLNFAKRKYRDYPVADVPQYATRHNASLSLRYTLNPLKSIIGITNRFASGRPYHDPNKSGWMNKKAPAYNSIDLSWTFLAHKKVIVFASASNILGRKNIYNYTWSAQPDNHGQYTGIPVRATADRFFFIGIFITLGGNTAYDVSNF